MMMKKTTSFFDSLADDSPSYHGKAARRRPNSCHLLKAGHSKTLDVQFYLDYFRTHITVHHYSLKRHTQNFLKGDF